MLMQNKQFALLDEGQVFEIFCSEAGIRTPDTRIMIPLL